MGWTDLKVKALGFGRITIQRVSEEEAGAVIRGCYELVLNCLDTAGSYTNKEVRIGEVLEEVRDELFLATKSGRRTWLLPEKAASLEEML